MSCLGCGVSHSNKTVTKMVFFSAVLHPHPKFTPVLEFLTISFQQKSLFWAHLWGLFCSLANLEDSLCSQNSCRPFIALIRPFIGGAPFLIRTIQEMQIKGFFGDNGSLGVLFCLFLSS